MPAETDYRDETQAPTREEIDGTSGPVLLEFGTTWCGHCRALAPRVAEHLALHPEVRHFKVEDGPGPAPGALVPGADVAQLRLPARRPGGEPARPPEPRPARGGVREAGRVGSATPRRVDVRPYRLAAFRDALRAARLLQEAESGRRIDHRHRRPAEADGVAGHDQVASGGFGRGGAHGVLEVGPPEREGPPQDRLVRRSHAERREHGLDGPPRRGRSLSPAARGRRASSRHAPAPAHPRSFVRRPPRASPPLPPAGGGPGARRGRCSDRRAAHGTSAPGTVGRQPGRGSRPSAPPAAGRGEA